MSENIVQIEENNNLPVLTEDQIKIIQKHWDTLDINALTKLVFNNNKLDGRNNEGKAIKIYLVGESRNIRTTAQKVLKGDLELTQEQKLFIETNAKDIKPLEMAKMLFPNENVKTLLSSYGRAVYKYSQELNKDNVSFWDEPVDKKEYQPPKTIQHILGLTNSYVSNQLDPTKDAYDFNNLRPFEVKCLRSLQGYLKTIRFRYQASSYEKKADRTLFESTFIRLTHDKNDLSAADVDMYAAAAAETVNITREERKILRLEEQLDQILSGDEEKQKLSQAFVELLNQTRTKWDTSKARYKGFVESLESTRSKRDEHKIKQNQSVLNLLEAWQKDEQTRNDIIAFGDKEKEEDKDEIKRLTEFDGVVALIAGHTKEEASS